MNIDLIMFDWGWTLATVNRQMEAFRRGAMAVVRLLTSSADSVLAETLVAEAAAAETRAANDPELREVDLLDLLRWWAAAHGFKLDADGLKAALAVVGTNWIGALEPIPGVAEALQSLKQSGYRLGLVSNCFLPVQYCRQEVARHGFTEFLDFTLFSSEVGYRKPSPRVYEEAWRRAFGDHQPADWPRVLFVGDSPVYDVITPARLGMKTALVTSTTDLWSPADFDQARPDLRINSVAHLPQLLAAKASC